MASPSEPETLLLEEHRLVECAQKGDRQAFAALVERYWDQLYRWLCHLTHDSHTAEDLVQETFLKAFAGLDKFQVGTNLRAWLFRIAHNRFASQQRIKGRNREALPEALISAEEGPMERALSREAFQLLARAVGRLPVDFRSAFLLRVDEGLSFRQIGEVLGISEETARWRVFKARQQLLSVMAPHRGQDKP